MCILINIWKWRNGRKSRYGEKKKCFGLNRSGSKREVSYEKDKDVYCSGIMWHYITIFVIVFILVYKSSGIVN